MTHHAAIGVSFTLKASDHPRYPHLIKCNASRAMQLRLHKLGFGVFDALYFLYEHEAREAFDKVKERYP